MLVIEDMLFGTTILIPEGQWDGFALALLIGPTLVSLTKITYTAIMQYDSRTI